MTESLAGKPISEQRDAEQPPAAHPSAGQPTEGEATSAQSSNGQSLAGAPVSEILHPAAQAGDAPRAEVSEEDQVPEWLKDLRASSIGEAMETGATQSSETSGREPIPAADAEEAVSTAATPVEEELPEWLQAGALPNEPPTVTAAPEIQTPPQGETSHQELPEWLSEPHILPSGEKTAAQLEANETPPIAPQDKSVELTETRTPQVERGAPPVSAEQTAPVTEPLDLQVPDFLTAEPQAEQPQEVQPTAAPVTETGEEEIPLFLSWEPQAEQPQEAQAAESKVATPGAEDTSAPPPVIPPPGLEGAPKPIEAGELPDWLRELAPADLTLPPTKPLRGEPPQLAPSELQGLPSWLREPFSDQEVGTPTLPGAEPGVQPLTPLPGMAGWMERLAPPLERAISGEPVAEVTETEGPLAGVRGVLPLALSIAEPHTLSAPSQSPNNAGRMFESVLAATAEGALVPTATISKPVRRSWGNRWIYLLVLLAALIPLFVPSNLAGLGLEVNNSTPTARFYDKIRSLAPGSTVLVAFDYDAGQAVELGPAAGVIVRDLAQRHVNVVGLSTSPAGAQIAQATLLEVSRQNPNWRRGENYVNVGYIPGAEAGLRALTDRLLSANQIDFDKQPLASLPLAKKVTQLSDFALAIEFAGGDASLRWWMEQVQPQKQVTFVAAVSAAVEPEARNYLAANQLAAFLRGLGGAAEYELFSNQTGPAVRTIDAQSFSQIVVVAIIVLGNLILLFGRLRKSQPSQS